MSLCSRYSIFLTGIVMMINKVCTVSGMDAWLRGVRDFCTSAPLQRLPRAWPLRVNPPPRGFTVWG